MLVKSKNLGVNDQLQEFSPEDLGDVGSAPQGGLNLRPYLRTLGRKAWLIVGLTAVTTTAASFWSALDPHTYTGSFYLLVEPITPYSKISDPTTIARTGGVPRDELFDLDYPTNLAFLRSPGMTYKIAEDIHKKEPDQTVPSIWKDIRDNLTVERVGETRTTATKIFAVTYKGEKPGEVQRVLEVAADTFLKYSAQDRETSLKAGVKFIDQQLPDLEKKLKNLRDQQQKLRNQYELIDPVNKGNEVLSQVNQLDLQILEVENQLKAQRALSTSLQQQLNLTPQEALAAASLSQNSERNALLTQLQQLEIQIASESSRFTFDSPSLQVLQEQKQTVLKLLNEKTQAILAQNGISLPQNSPVLKAQDPTRLKLIEQLVESNNQIQQLETRYQSLNTARANREIQSKRYPEVIRRYQELEREITLTSNILDRLQTQRQTLTVESAQELPWQLVSPPQIPLDKDGNPISQPPERKKKLLAGVMGGLLLGGLLSIGIEKRRNVFYSTEDIKDVLSLPIVGNIPWDDSNQFSILTIPPVVGESENEGKYEDNLLSHNRGIPFTNAFDFLLTEISVLYHTPPLHSFVVSSVESQDGQSSVAFYLAKAAAATGKRVLLVDANFTAPSLHDWFGLSNHKGLSNLLKDSDLETSDVVQESPSFENLFLLPAGTIQSNSAKLLWLPKMQSLMKEFKVKYDLIIYDAPHFYDSTDVSFLGANTDGILMVIGVGKTSQSTVKKAVKEIDKLRLPLLGIVANHPRSSSQINPYF